MALRLSSSSSQFEDFRLRIDARVIALVVIAVLAVVGLWGSFYTVRAEEVGVVLRFGKYIKTVEPGLRFKIPFWVDTVDKVPVRRQLKQEFGFGTLGATDQTQFSPGRYEQDQEKSMVTGDLNAALVEWVIQYRIDEPTEFLFDVRQPSDILRDVSESIMREVVGDRTVDEVITFGRQEIESEALVKLQELTDRYQMGITIDQVQLKNVNPPTAVQGSFNEVNQAQQEREKMINIANGDYNREVPKARGEAQRMIQEAEGYAIQRINEAEGDAARFIAVFEEYLKAPEVTRRRIYLETLHEVMPQLRAKIIVDDEARQVLPLLPLGPNVPSPVQR
ncbi:MAG: FtsH protease activity modulator HflK [Planctomycetota bacterium]|jgi:membrane protease subunit HflK